MSSWRFVFRSLRFHWRINLAVALGVAAATAVLAGALLVGDSVRGSLRDLTLDRLGKIDEVLLTDRYFRAELADELSAAEGFASHFASATAALLFPQGTLEKPARQQVRRAAGVLVVGCDAAFWDLGQASERPGAMPARGEIILNQPLADDLDAQLGDQLVLRLPKATEIPPDSTLAQKTGRIRSLVELRVIEILPARSLGRFSLRPNQVAPRNAYLAIETLQDALDQRGKVNAILVSNGQVQPPEEAASQALANMLRPSLSDLGLTLQRVRRTFRPASSDQEEVIFDYYSLTTDRMILPPEADRAAQRAFAEYGGQPLLTYLANTIAKVDDDKQGIPYSTITGVDNTPAFDYLALAEAAPPQLAADQIALNQWAAQQLQAKLGDRFRISYFEPETTHGQAKETSHEFTLAAIVPLTEPAEPYDNRRPARFDQRPTLLNDPDLTPVVEGITDRKSIANWDPPFPYDSRRIGEADEDYWQNHRTTPKALVSFATAQRLWGSRFGRSTSYRIPAREGLNEQVLETRFLDQLRADGATLGFTFSPVKRQGLQASRGTTPFDVLFLFLSFFVIAAALMLVALLFRLGVEQRATELGTVLAMGLPRKLAIRLWVAEGVFVAALGALPGLAVAVGYAWLMLTGLRTWWVGAVVTPFLQMHMTWLSLGLGYSLGVLVSVVTIYLGVRQTRRFPLRRLLAGQTTEPRALVRYASHLPDGIALLLLLVAMGLTAAATVLGGEAQAGAFVGSGALLLAAILIWIWRRLRSGGGAAKAIVGGAVLWRLARRNAGRNPARSTLTIGLMAAASFLIVAMSAFRLAPTEQGTGGFDLMAESAQPVFEDLQSPQGRDEILAGEAGLLDGGTVLSLRVKPGDDASCRNLYQPNRPRVLAVPPAMLRYFDDPEVPRFAFASSAAQTAEQQRNPWRLLETPGGEKDVVPVVLDKNTAMYSLQKYGGIGEEFDVTYEDGTTVTFRVVGLLANSVLQGNLLISEAHFTALFPNIGGYRFFLIRSPVDGGQTADRAAEDKKSQRVAQLLEEALGDQGFDAISSRDHLAGLLAVQNTYLSTFQSLGFLGLLLGTFGLATVQLRSVLERRSELALMRAAGFRRSRLAQMVLAENVLLLVGGLATGTVAAVLAVMPHGFFSQISPPWRDLVVMLSAVVVVGILSGASAVWLTLRAPLLSSLRGE